MSCHSSNTSCFGKWFTVVSTPDIISYIVNFSRTMAKLKWWIKLLSEHLLTRIRICVDYLLIRLTLRVFGKVVVFFSRTFWLLIVQLFLLSSLLSVLFMHRRDKINRICNSKMLSNYRTISIVRCILLESKKTLQSVQLIWVF